MRAVLCKARALYHLNSFHKSVSDKTKVTTTSLPAPLLRECYAKVAVTFF
jgi:hypothetical protein